MAQGAPVVPAEDGSRPATAKPARGPVALVSARDAGTLISPDSLVRGVIEELAADARRRWEGPEAPLLWAFIGELHEFGTGDVDAALDAYEKACGTAQSPAAALAGLRRLARRRSDAEAVGRLYQLESQTAGDTDQLVRAMAQRALWLLRHGARRGLEPIARALAQLDLGDPWASLLASVVREDLALVGKRHQEAAAVRSSRFTQASAVLAADDPAGRAELAALAAGLGMMHRHLTGDVAEAAKWLEQSLELTPSESALRELAGLRAAAEKLVALEGRLSDFAARVPEAAARSRARYELGMLRNYRLDDVEGAREAFSAGMREPEVGYACAAPFLQLTSGLLSTEQADPSGLVDALGLQAEWAATPRERADCLYLMGLIFDRDLQMPDAAVEVLRDALAVHPGHRPAARALGRLYQRRGAWSLLAELLESEIARFPHSRRNRMKLAEVYLDRLNAPNRAEPHLRALLALGLYGPAVHRLSALLGAQERWPELCQHLIECARAEQDVRERIYNLERAAEIAESRMDQPEVAIQCWAQVHELDPLHPGAVAALGRLYTRLARWEELIQLNKDEIAVRDEPRVATRLWTKTGDIYGRRLDDEESAQQCYQLALEVDPTYEPALAALGRILWRNRDWHGLVEMYANEIEGLSRGPKRRRRLLDLAELLLVRAGQPKRALAVVEQVLAEDPHCEEGLLWCERVAQAMGDDALLLDVLEHRLQLVPPESRPGLALRAGALAEWALEDPERAWSHYHVALADRRARALALAGLYRLWPRRDAQVDGVEATVETLGQLLEDERDATVRGLAAALRERIGRGATALADWPAALAENPADLVAAAATEVGAALRGDVATLLHLRRDRQLDALWAAAALVDGPPGEAPGAEGEGSRPPAPVRLPATPISAQLVAEMDLDLAQLAGQPDLAALAGLGVGAGSDGDAEPARSEAAPLALRALVRAVLRGAPLPDVQDHRTSIGCLRLGSHAALAGGDAPRAAAYNRLEAGLWSDDASRQRRLTTAAELCWRQGTEGAQAEARGLFERALVLGCYREDSRRLLYDTLERCDLTDLVIDGLREHIAQLEEPSERVEWLYRLAAAEERRGERIAAAEAWANVLEAEPTNAMAILEQARLLTLEGCLDEARQLLERTLRRAIVGHDRLLLLGRQADLQLMEGGDGTKALAALEEANKLVDDSADDVGVWKRRLARVHYRFGAAERALTLLVEALPSEVDEADLSDWFLLARVKYLRLDDADGARELLWGLFEQFPAVIESLRELEAFYRKTGGAAELAERLSTLLVDPPAHLDDTTRAFLWEYVGDLNYQVLRRNRDAEIAFEAAAQADAPIARLALKAARAVAQQPGKGREACFRFARALRRPEVDVADWLEVVEDLSALFEGIEDHGRVRVMKQIGDLLQGKRDPDGDERRVKRDPARRIDPEVALEKLVNGLCDPISQRAMLALAPIVDRCFGDRRARRRALGGRRLRSGDAPDFLTVLDLGAEAIEASSVKVYVGNGGDQPEWLSNGGHWFPTERFESADYLAQRFWAGHVVGFQAFGLAPLSLCQPGDLEDVLAEVRRVTTGDEPSFDRTLKEVASSRFATQREELWDLMVEHDDLIERVAGEHWAQLPLWIADRYGLLLCGDVRVAVDAILSLDDDLRPGRRSRRIIGDRRSRMLLEFAFGYAYQELRHLAGLAAKPKLV